MTYSDISDFAFRKKRIEKGYNILINLVSGIDEVYWDENQDWSIREKVSSELYKVVTGENLSSLLTDEQRKMAMELMTEDERRYVEAAKENPDKLRCICLSQRRN